MTASVSAIEPQVTDFGRRAIPFLVAGAFFMENLDGTVIVTALPTMARAFHVQTADMSIGVSAYLLALAMFIPASGWVTDRLGGRRVFAAAILGFTVASGLCAASRGLLTFTAARVLQGAAGAMMVPVGRLVVLRNTAKADLIHAVATITWPGLAAPVLGPPLGGFIVLHASWHWIFLLNVPIGLVGLYLALRLIPRATLPARRPFDWGGFLLTGAACVVTVSGVEWLSQRRAGLLPWALVGVGLATGVAAYLYARWHEHPMLDPWAIRVPTFAAVVRGGSCFRAVVASMPFLIPLMFQLGLGMDPFHAGLLMLALFAGNLAMKPLTTRVLRRFPFRGVLLVNGAITAGTFFGCAAIGRSTPVVVSVVILFAAGLARSMQFTTFNTLAFADVPPERMSGANTLFNTAFQLAMGLGIALGATSLRLAGWLTGNGSGNPNARDFRIALACMGCLCLLSLGEFARLAPTAGDVVRRPTNAGT